MASSSPKEFLFTEFDHLAANRGGVPCLDRKIFKNLQDRRAPWSWQIARDYAQRETSKLSRLHVTNNCSENPDNICVSRKIDEEKQRPPLEIFYFCFRILLLLSIR